VDQLREGRAVHARTEIGVGEQDVAIGAGQKVAQGAARIGRGHHGEPLVGQRLGHQFAEQGLILDQQHDLGFRFRRGLLGRLSAKAEERSSFG